MRNVAAALVAIICWAGLALQFSASYGQSHDVAATVWTLARFFTIISNLVVAVAMTAVAAGRRLSALAMGGLTLAILLVGVVYWVLLHGLHPLSGAALTANFLLHDASPLLMLAYWFVFVPRAKLRWSAPWWWNSLSRRLPGLRPRPWTARPSLPLSLHRRRQARLVAGRAERRRHCLWFCPRRFRAGVDRQLASTWVERRQALERPR